MRILVVEDEITLCETIAKGLRLDGYEVDTCFDGGNAWNMAMDEHPRFKLASYGWYGSTP